MRTQPSTGEVMAWTAAGVAAAVGLLLLMLAVQSVRAHGPAEWIQRGGYKNAAGELCCGERDCFELLDDDVKITAAGYFVVSMKETIPFNEATPSPDGKYWRCQWGGCGSVSSRLPARPDGVCLHHRAARQRAR